MSKLDREIIHFEDITITYYPENEEIVDIDVDKELTCKRLRIYEFIPTKRKPKTDKTRQGELRRLRRHSKRNADRGEQFYEGIDEDKETKQCTHCKRTLPLSKFQRAITKTNGYSIWCRDCRAEYTFLYGSRKTQRGYLYGTGICLRCGELNPLLLENHHIFGRKNTDDVVSLCSNCHTLHRYYPMTIWPQLREPGTLGNPE